MSTAPEWLVYSVEHTAWHRPGFAGYVSHMHIAGAGLFTAGEAKRYGGNPNKDRIIHVSEKEASILLALADARKEVERLETFAIASKQPAPASRCVRCGVPIDTAELCTGCASGNDPFAQSKRSTGRTPR